MALKGRGQDLAKLTADGVPDTSALLVVLMLGASKGHGASLQPVALLEPPSAYQPTSVFETGVLAGGGSFRHRRRRGACASSSRRSNRRLATTRRGSRPSVPRPGSRVWTAIFPAGAGSGRWCSDRETAKANRPWSMRPGLPRLLHWHQGHREGRAVLLAQPVAARFNHNTGDVQFTPAAGWEWAVKGDHARDVRHPRRAQQQPR